MRLKSTVLAAALLGVAAAHAHPLTIDLPGAAERQTVAYTCDGGRKVTAE